MTTLLCEVSNQHHMTAAVFTLVELAQIDIQQVFYWLSTRFKLPRFAIYIGLHCTAPVSTSCESRL